MCRGCAATDGQFAYFAPQDTTSLYQYEYCSEKWRELPSCPYQNSGLVVVKGELTTVGGQDGVYRTNKLFSLQRNTRWVEAHPPMNTSRFGPAIVSTSDGEIVIVIGGRVAIGGRGWSTIVELFQIKSSKWTTLHCRSLQ